MINTTPYHNKLDKLKEYMNAKIDGIVQPFWIDIDAIPRMNTEYFLRMYAEIGVMLYNGNPPPEPPRKLSFEEWYSIQENKNT